MTRRRVAIPTAAAAIFLAASIALTGCTVGSPASPSPDAASSAPATTPPASSAPPTAAPEGRDATAPLEAIDAYALCKAQTTGYYPGDFALVEFAPFADAFVRLRDDGRWFVNIEVDDGNREASLVEVAASECIVGGTIGEPEWQLFGSTTRETAEQLELRFNNPLASA
jgi:hypothetical protein